MTHNGCFGIVQHGLDILQASQHICLALWPVFHFPWHFASPPCAKAYARMLFTIRPSALHPINTIMSSWGVCELTSCLYLCPPYLIAGNNLQVFGQLLSPCQHMRTYPYLYCGSSARLLECHWSFWTCLDYACTLATIWYICAALNPTLLLGWLTLTVLYQLVLSDSSMFGFIWWI